MAIQISSELLEGIVLSVLKNEDLYGYVLTQKVQARFPISESTIYPVLRRLKKNNYLKTYDQPYQGRNRRYYQLTEGGDEHLVKIIDEWTAFSHQVNQALEENR